MVWRGIDLNSRYFKEEEREREPVPFLRTRQGREGGIRKGLDFNVDVTNQSCADHVVSTNILYCKFIKGKFVPEIVAFLSLYDVNGSFSFLIYNL